MAGGSKATRIRLHALGAVACGWDFAFTGIDWERFAGGWQAEIKKLTVARSTAA
jgi:hypothetical protein